MPNVLNAIQSAIYLLDSIASFFHISNACLKQDLVKHLLGYTMYCPE